MRALRRRRALIGAAAAVPTALAVAPIPAVAADVAPPPPEEQPGGFCSTSMLSAEELDTGAISVIRCFDTLDESLRAIGVEPAADGVITSSGATTNADSVIAVHYEDIAGRGEELRIGGASCNGGGISFGAGDPWNDRIRSTAPKGCSRIKHWVDANFSGASETVAGSQATNLSGALAGQVSSMRYYA